MDAWGHGQMDTGMWGHTDTWVHGDGTQTDRHTRRGVDTRTQPVTQCDTVLHTLTKTPLHTPRYTHSYTLSHTLTPCNDPHMAAMGHTPRCTLTRWPPISHPLHGDSVTHPPLHARSDTQSRGLHAHRRTPPGPLRRYPFPPPRRRTSALDGGTGTGAGGAGGGGAGETGRGRGGERGRTTPWGGRRGDACPCVRPCVRLSPAAVPAPIR